MIFWILSIVLAVICIGSIILDVFFGGTLDTFFLSVALFAGFFLIIPLCMGGFWHQCGRKAKYLNERYGTDFTQKELFMTDEDIIMLRAIEGVIKEELSVEFVDDTTYGGINKEEQ